MKAAGFAGRENLNIRINIVLTTPHLHTQTATLVRLILDGSSEYLK
jgi:hypothetical protein